MASSWEIPAARREKTLAEVEALKVKIRKEIWGRLRKLGYKMPEGDNCNSHSINGIYVYFNLNHWGTDGCVEFILPNQGIMGRNRSVRTRTKKNGDFDYNLCVGAIIRLVEETKVKVEAELEVRNLYEESLGFLAANGIDYAYPCWREGNLEVKITDDGSIQLRKAFGAGDRTEFLELFNQLRNKKVA